LTAEISDDELFAKLRRVSTATLTTQLFKRGLRSMFMAGLSPLNPAKTRFAGRAFTLRSIPARENIDTLSIFEDPTHPQRVAFDQVPAGSVLVMDCRGVTRAASGGFILFSRALVRGIAAVVSDGALRDSEPISTLPFPVFAQGRAATPNLASHHAIDVNVPIGCAEVAVYPGDVLVGDADGVVCVPAELAVEIADEALAQEELEDFLLAKIQAGASLPGTYPPSAEVLDEYRRHRQDQVTEVQS
jgi:Demethylmenaquinone methyltransferase